MFSQTRFSQVISVSLNSSLYYTQCSQCHLLGIQWESYTISVQFSRSVMSKFLWPHEPQLARPPCPSSTPRVHSNPCPSSWWCHPTISSSVVPFSSCSQSFPASGSFQTSQLFASGVQSIGVSASTSVLPMNTRDWSPLGWLQAYLNMMSECWSIQDYFCVELI